MESVSKQRCNCLCDWHIIVSLFCLHSCMKSSASMQRNTLTLAWLQQSLQNFLTGSKRYNKILLIFACYIGSILQTSKRSKYWFKKLGSEKLRGKWRVWLRKGNDFWFKLLGDSRVRKVRILLYHDSYSSKRHSFLVLSFWVPLKNFSWVVGFNSLCCGISF